MTRPSRQTAAMIFLFGVCLTLCVRVDDIETTDEILSLYSAAALIHHGDFDLPVRDVYHPDFYVAAPNGKYYAKFGPGQALALAPFVALARIWINPADSLDIAGHKTVLVSMALGSVLIPLMGVLGFELWSGLGYARSVSALSAVSLMATTELLPYSRSIFGDVMCAFLSFAAFVLLAGRCGSPPDNPGHPPSAFRIALAGAALGFAVLVRPVTVLFVPPFVLYLALVWIRSGVSSSALRAQLIAGFFGFAPFAVALLAFNAHAYGSPWSTGYRGETFQFNQSILSGAFHNLFSFEKGLLIYSPTLMLSFLFWKKFHRAHPAESTFAIVFVALYVWVYGGWYASRPGFDISYGQRFLLPTVAFCALAIPECFAWCAGMVSRSLVCAALAFGVSVQVSGCLQRGILYREWAAQYQTHVPTWMGYVLKSLAQPASIEIWWLKSGPLAALLAGVAFAALAVYFAIRAVRG